MKLIAVLSEEKVATQSYELFRVLVEAPVSSIFTEERKWEASRLALHTAYKWDWALPQVKDPKPIVTFLSYHLQKFTVSSTACNEPVQDALRALISLSTPEATEALKDFDPNQDPHNLAIIYLFDESKPLQFRKTALFFLPLIADKYFTDDDITANHLKERLCVDWAFTVGEVLHTGLGDAHCAVLAVLLSMINSCWWRFFVPLERWKLLKLLDSRMDDSQPFARCLQNPDLVEAASVMRDPNVTDLWFKILLMRYNRLSPQVRKQLGVCLRGDHRGRIKEYLKMAVDARLIYGVESYTEAFYGPLYEPDDTLSFDPESFEVVIEFLESLKRDGR